MMQWERKQVSEEIAKARKETATAILKEMFYFADANSYRGIVQATSKVDEYLLQDDVFDKIHELFDEYGVEVE